MSASVRRWTVALAALLVAFAACAMPARAQAITQYGSVKVSYKVVPTVKMTVIPNFQSGYGPIGGSGSGSTPAVGALAAPGAGYVDFGNVVAGYSYLYRYAAQLNVTTNDLAGFNVYGEGSTDLTGSAGTYTISQLYWLVSSGSNGPFTPSTPFSKTAGTPTGGGTNITYASLPSSAAIVWASAAPGTLQQGYDYQLHLDSAIPIAQWNAYVVYTAVGN